MLQSKDNWKPCVCEVDFDRVNRAALARSYELIPALFPGGVTSGPQDVVPRPNEPRRPKRSESFSRPEGRRTRAMNCGDC